MNKQTVLVPADFLEAFMVSAFKKIGVPAKDAKVCASVTIAASKRGIDSHGIERFKSYYYDRIQTGILSPTTILEIIRQSPTTAVLDGHNGMGHVIAKKAMSLAMKKAKRYGMGMVAVRNSTHYGIAGYYAMMATEKDMIGITGTNTRNGVAPAFGVESIIGTNPLTFAMPTDEAAPFVMDAATSLAQLGKVAAYARVGKQLPEGWVIDSSGKSVTDASLAHAGLTNGTMALTPFGGYKGYGYAIVVEILSAALSGGSYLKMLSGIKDGKKIPIPVSHFFIAINIAAFLEPEEFKQTTGNILRTLRASKKMPGHTRIYTPYEKENEVELVRSKEGIPVIPQTQKDLLQIQKEQHLKQFDFTKFGILG
jgi:L-2-hydroxycarboxylate dehydrogenase (NAD+)